MLFGGQEASAGLVTALTRNRKQPSQKRRALNAGKRGVDVNLAPLQTDACERFRRKNASLWKLFLGVLEWWNSVVKLRRRIA
jgi:hypothetical protein